MAVPARDGHIDLASAVHDGLRRFATLAKRTKRDPSANRVHDLRVTTRRLRADFWLIPRSRRTRAIRRARRDLAHLAAVLGEQRKYDVAREDAARYGGSTKRLDRKLRRARRDVVRALGRERREKYLDHLQRAVADTAMLPVDALSARAAALRRQLERARRHPPATDAARHRLRINVKKARYLLEAGGQPVDAVVRLQDHLGRWHDLTVLADLVDRRPELAAAREREWRLAERHLAPALTQAIRHLPLLFQPRGRSGSSARR